MAKRYSIIVIPEEGNKVSSFRLRGGIVQFAICCFLIAVGLSSFFTYKYFNFNMDYAELRRLQVSTIEQHQTLLSLTADLNAVHRQMDDLAESEARVRQLADLGSLPEDVPVAIGGIQELDPSDDVDEIQRQIHKLQVAIELRRQSQEGVRNLLNDQVSLSRATPKGWPTKGWLTSYFGMRKSPFSGRRVMHEGLDIAANTGTPVIATADGIVSRVKYSPDYGKMVIIDHGYGYRTIFAHNSKILVKSGQRIKRGDMVAQVGNTGRSTGSHLHYELRLNGVPIDPRKTL